jgi:putative DNA primase/helicase
MDIDTLDQEIGDALQELIDEHLGAAPIRYGRAPKRAMPFRLAGEPFGKLQITWRPIADTGDVGRKKPPGLEILAAGQQFVALGVHKDTGATYRWERDPDLSIPRSLLPGLDRARADRFMRVAARFIVDIGGELINGASLAEPPVRTARRPLRRPQVPGQQSIAAALERIGNPDLHYDQWIRIGLALKSALGEGGRDLWLWWSALSGKNDPRLTERKWTSFKPTRIGAGSIFYLLRNP